jgi:nitroreductase
MQKLLFILVIAFMGINLNSCSQKKNETATQPASNKASVVMQNIMDRHSIRSYTAEQVARNIIDSIVKAGINAPSARNLQPWEVRVVRNPELLAQIKKLSPKFYDAPTLLLIANDTANEYSQFDCGLIAQNIMLAAESYDIGSVALGMVQRDLNSGIPEAKAILEKLNLPVDYKIIIGIALGYKNEKPEAKPRNEKKVIVIE